MLVRTGAWVMVAAAALAACGAGEGLYDESPTAPAPQATQSDDEFLALKPTLDRECTRCHNGRVHPLRLDSPAAFKGSDSKRRIENRSMPPDRQLDEQSKSALLRYLG